MIALHTVYVCMAQDALYRHHYRAAIRYAQAARAILAQFLMIGGA